FRTREDYLRYAALIAGRPPGKDGMSIVHPNAKAIMLDGSAIRSDELLQHELAHHFVRQTHGVLPLWLDEGLAEYYGATRILPGSVQIGRQRPRNRRLF